LKKRPSRNGSRGCELLKTAKYQLHGIFLGKSTHVIEAWKSYTPTTQKNMY